MAPTDEKPERHNSVDLKDPGLAAFLAWLIPGLGHLYQGRTAKAGLFFVCIMGTFLYGLYLGSSNEVLPDGRKIGWGRVYYFEQPGPGSGQGGKRIVFTVAKWACEVGIGLPTLPALIQYKRMSDQKKVWWGGFMAPPWIPSADEQKNRNDPNSDQPTADDLHKYLHRYFQLGAAYTMIAGLLNILTIYDAWGGPVFSQPARKKEEDEDQENEDQENQKQKDADAPAEVP